MSTEQEQTKFADNVSRIANLLSRTHEFWSINYGYARKDSHNILSKARVDRLSSLSLTLLKHEDGELLESEGELILAWAALGSILEGVLKFYLTIYIIEYNITINKKEFPFFYNKKGKQKGPDELSIGNLKYFFSMKIFTKEVREIYRESGEIDWIEWIGEVQRNRNAIHSFIDRKILRKQELFLYVEEFLELLRRINSDIPYPENEYRPKEK